MKAEKKTSILFLNDSAYKQMIEHVYQTEDFEVFQTWLLEDRQAYADQEKKAYVKDLVPKLAKALEKSLGDMVEGNDYEITSDGLSRWISHKEVGSGEPLRQWIVSELLKQIEDE